MTHYLADWQARAHKLTMSPEQWNKLIDNFDVEGLAKQLESVGAGYYLITLGQNSGYYLSPNATYDKLVGISPSKCSRRDLVADLYDALSKRKIRLMVYLPSGAPAGDRVAVKALEWRNGPYRNREFQLKWEQVIREWSLRWGKKVSGWWFDGCYWPNAMYNFTEAPNFASFTAATRAGNPDSAVAFSRGRVHRILSLTPYEDFTGGEVNDPQLLILRRIEDGKQDGTQVHAVTHLGETWGMGAPRFSADYVVKWSQPMWEFRGAITWDTPAQLNGLIAQPFLDQLAALSQAARKR